MSTNGKTVVLCDFDGTVTVEDSLDTVFDHLAPPGWREIGRRARSRGGTRTSIPVEVALCQAKREDFEQVVREKVSLRPGFREFLALCRERGWEFVILSEGFALHIETVLRREGLSGLRYYSNDLVFHGDGISVSQPYANPDCGLCGNCKSGHLKRYRERGYGVIYIGDGITDFCPARQADLVLARGALADYCNREGIDHIPFDDFYDVVHALRQGVVLRAEE